MLFVSNFQTWQYDVSWLYCIDFLGAEEFDFDTRYRFRVRWSIPTRRKPIPRATASVYFSFVVSKIKPEVFTFVCLMVFNTTFNNISDISWQSVLLMEEIGRPAETH